MYNKLLIAFIIGCILFFFVYKQEMFSSESEESEEFDTEIYNMNQGRKLLNDINTRLNILKQKEIELIRKEQKLNNNNIINSKSLSDFQIEYTLRQQKINKLKDRCQGLIEDHSTIASFDNMDTFNQSFIDQFNSLKQASLG